MKKIKIDKIIRSKRKSFSLEVNRDGSLIVRAPKNASDKAIHNIVNKKRFWIRDKMKFVNKKYSKLFEKEFVNGEGFLYLGDVYRLFIKENNDSPLTFNNRYFSLSKENIENARELLIKWYKEQAYSKISERALWFSSLSGIKYNKINITNAQKRWGSCSAKGNLNFSWRLIMAPLRVIDYVIVHELAHIEEKDHSNNFWNKVKVMMPNYKNYKNWLKENEHLLVF